MENDKIKFEDRVFNMLYKLVPYAAYEIKKNVRPENQDRFVRTVKMFIDSDYGRSQGFYIEFDDSYSFIKKKNY